MPTKYRASAYGQALLFAVDTVAIAAIVAVVLPAVCLLAFLMNGRKFFFRRDRKQLAPALPLPTMSAELMAVNGISLFVVRHGKGSGKPLMLFVHGFPESWYTWRHQLKEFAGEYEVAAVNLRGYGPSQAPQGVEAYHLQCLVQDICCLVEALGHERCVLVGHDWGSTICWEAARQFPSMVHCLVAMSAPPGWKLLRTMREHRPQRWRSYYIAVFKLPLLPELLLSCNDFQAIGDAFTGTSGVKNPEHCMTAKDVEQMKAGFSYPGSLTAALNYYRALMERDPWQGRKPAPLSGVPVLQLHGDQDVALTAACFANAHEWADNINLAGSCQPADAQFPEARPVIKPPIGKLPLPYATLTPKKLRQHVIAVAEWAAVTMHQLLRFAALSNN